jgi:ATP-binding cassette subfamily F protein uup
MPAKMLSGGERNRLLLARLFLQPANVLVLDEPTNDLDAETLELLEELLLEYTGTLLLVSHDRAFLDNVVTSTLVFEGEGRVTEYTGGYEDWIRQRPEPLAAAAQSEAKLAAKPAGMPAPSVRLEKGPKFLKREQRELDELPAVIEKMETDLSALNARLWDPEIYKKQPENVSKLKTELAVLEERIKNGYTRWEQLEEKRKACEGAG